jgi:hypothetical protein
MAGELLCGGIMLSFISYGDLYVSYISLLSSLNPVTDSVACGGRLTMFLALMLRKIFNLFSNMKQFD